MSDVDPKTHPANARAPKSDSWMQIVYLFRHWMLRHHLRPEDAKITIEFKKQADLYAADQCFAMDWDGSWAGDFGRKPLGISVSPVKLMGVNLSFTTSERGNYIFRKDILR